MSFFAIALREGDQYAKELAELIVKTALDSLATQEKGGFGLALNGRFRKGFPIRVSAASTLSAIALAPLTRSLRPSRNSDLTEFANEVLERNFRLVVTVRGVGNVYFYTI